MKISTLAKAGLVTGMVMMTAAGSFAEGRVDSMSMTCKEAQRLVKDQGVVQMQTGPARFDRIVSHRRHCLKDQILKRYFAPTSDKKRCKVGNICEFSTGKSG